MTAVAVCLIIGIINLILWAVLFLHFKSKYSSEKILEDIADELNKLIRDINNETNRCVTIVEACKKDIQKFVEELSYKSGYKCDFSRIAGRAHIDTSKEGLGEVMKVIKDKEFINKFIVPYSEESDDNETYFEPLWYRRR